ncbi:MAG: hypothetical protein VCA55_12990 [Verrucomicrobiales bacterium]
MSINDSLIRRIPGLKLNLGNIRRPRIGSLFWWTIAIILLGICTILSWTLTIYIFNHPNEPIPYKILTKLDKIAPLQQFTLDTPPPGKFHNARSLLENDFAGLETAHLKFTNDILLRNYLENFRRAENVIYISGKFSVDYIRELNSGDLFPQGLVFRGHAENFPKVNVEVILPTREITSPSLIKTGHLFDLAGTFFAALVRVSKPSDDSICLTLVPVVYGEKNLAEGKIEMHPPEQLNINGNWPLTSPNDIFPPTEATASVNTE